MSCLIRGVTLHLIHHNMFQLSVSGQYARVKKYSYCLPTFIWVFVHPDSQSWQKDYCHKDYRPKGKDSGWLFLSLPLLIVRVRFSQRYCLGSKWLPLFFFWNNALVSPKSSDVCLIRCVVISFSFASCTLCMTEFPKICGVSLGPSFKFQDSLPLCYTFLSLWGCEES